MAPALLQSSKKVCVMDASGYLGSNLVHKLAQRGYSVHAAVQDLNHGEQLLKKGKNNKNVTIFQADPLEYHSITDALKGCSALFYSFEPARDDDQPLIFDEFMADEEVRAAHNVLEACAQTDTIEKVIFTSSVTAVIWREDHKTTLDFDERSWTDVNFCRKFKLWYALAKTLAEKTALALAMDRDVQMVSINSGLLLGPELSIKSPYLKGAAEMYEDGVLATVDLKYLIDAHIFIFEDISAYGRYLCFNQIINSPDDADKFAQMLTPSSATSPPQCIGDTRIFQQRISCKKLEKAMVEFKC